MVRSAVIAFLIYYLCIVLPLILVWGHFDGSDDDDNEDSDGDDTRGGEGEDESDEFNLYDPFSYEIDEDYRRMMVTVFILAPLVIGTYGMYILISKRKNLRRKVERAEKKFESLGKPGDDSPRRSMEAMARKHYSDTMKAWSSMEKERLKELLENDLFERWEEDINKLKRDGQRNIVKGITIHKVLFLNLKIEEDDPTQCVVRFDATTTDYTVDERMKWVKPTWAKGIDPNPQMRPARFYEFWTFRLIDGKWKVLVVDGMANSGKYI